MVGVSSRTPLGRTPSALAPKESRVISGVPATTGHAMVSAHPFTPVTAWVSRGKNSTSKGVASRRASRSATWACATFAG